MPSQPFDKRITQFTITIKLVSKIPFVIKTAVFMILIL